MTLYDYVRAIRTHWIVILVLALLGAAAGYGYSQLVQPLYRSETQVIVVPTRGDSATDLVQGSNYVQSLVQTYSILATSPTVLDPVIDDLGLDDTAARLARRIDVTVPLDTVAITIGVTDPSPELARETADAIADELASAVEEVSPVGADQQPAVQVETIATARSPQFPIIPNTRLNTGIGLAAGLALGVVFALVRRKLKTKVSDAQGVSELTDLPILGEIPMVSDSMSVARAIDAHPHGRVAESMRQVAANLKFVDIDKSRRVIMVTSGLSTEGKSSVSLGLALTLAEAGHRVLYLEADLRRPSAATYTQLEGSVGLTNVLISDLTLVEAAQSWGRSNLTILTSGPTPPNPGYLLSSGRLQQVIEEGRARFDYVIVDTAPVLVVSDALWLSAYVDGTIFVVRANRTKQEQLTEALGALENTHTPILGVVVDGAAKSDSSPYYSEDAKAPRARRSRQPARRSREPARRRATRVR
ncbi:polysaccharide biosynthesis tyrosine autokinase [Epidermidibacterium keratini]|uniref:Polysaccharide biosynthesis tyrosine autokinase n=1 Tax=Epidermidibacterium keratini TaxID=1891644 RepID=A0A7L4YM70_9ACTN|nr:polysaccharide biosynthesis tyrosine autokinase [Epidermidibacterium keratini]QHC00152.1 polysaccharide biosynthesis tyrosine autokinase [Epidermidibacterium keratini]